MSALEDRRRARMRAVFAACREAGLDDDARRTLVAHITGRSSTAACTLSELAAVLDHLNRGRRARSGEWSFVFRAAEARQPLLKKIYRLAEKLGQLDSDGRPKSKAYVEGIARRMSGAPTALEFCDPERLRGIVTALEKQAARMAGHE